MQKPDNEDAIRNLLILLLLKNGVSPEAIEIATGIDQKTIRNRSNRFALAHYDQICFVSFFEGLRRTFRHGINS